MSTAKQKKYSMRNSAVADVFSSYPKEMREKLMYLRQLIFDTASVTQGVGELEETLKWGEPSYVTMETKSGSTVRIDRIKSGKGQYAVYFNCQTNLIGTFRAMFPTQFTYEGNRAIIFNEYDEVPVKELRRCISLALTYHQRKKRRKGTMEIGK